MKIMILGIMTFILFYVTNWHIDNVLEQKFYDGEGNEIPTQIVELLVQSQFVLLEPHEEQAIRAYCPSYTSTFDVGDRITILYGEGDLGEQMFNYILYGDTSELVFNHFKTK